MFSNRKAWQWRSLRTALTARSARFCFPLLLLFALVLGAAYSAQAGTFFCGQPGDLFGSVIDGFDPATFAYISTTNNTLGIDGNCTIKNWPQDNGIGGFPITNINFYFPGGADYYIIFDNVYYTGNMSCNDPKNSNFWIYWTPGGYTDISSKCQEAIVPADAVIKQNPPAQTTAVIGVPFTYTITAPYLGKIDPITGNTFDFIKNYDDYQITNVVITDDLTYQLNPVTGWMNPVPAALSYVTNHAYLVDGAGNRTPLNGGNPLLLGVPPASTWLSDHPVSATQPRLSDNTKHLVFSYEKNPDLATGVPAGYHIEIDLTVVLDDNTTANFPDNWFTNTVNMWYDKIITYKRSDGTTGSTSVANLDAWPSTTPLMTIVGPNLVVTKISTMTNLNVGTTAPFKIDVQNIGSGTAWDAVITDDIPAGMCTNPATSFTAGLYAADGTSLLANLVQGTDYSLALNGWGTAASCQLILTMQDSSPNQIGPNQHLIITYGAQLDAGTSPGLNFTNVAGATLWYGAKSIYDATGRHMYGPNSLSDGTPNIVDWQAAWTITSATQGYFFLKSVADLTTGVSENPTTSLSAFPGDILLYTLQIQNFQVPALDGITIIDDLGLNTPGAFVPGITVVSNNLPAAATVTTCDSCGTGGAPKITITGLNLPGNTLYQIQFKVTLASTLGNGTVVYNQASLTGTDEFNKVWSGVSDDSFINGTVQLGNTGDKTPVTIHSPGPLSKASPNPSTATIGQTFTYYINIPATPVNIPMYDVQITDTLPANVTVISAELLSGSNWIPLSATGTPLVIKNSTTGIDIPAGGQAVIRVTVALQNTTANTSGVLFTNSATYTFNKLQGGNSSTLMTVTPAGTADMTVIEPRLTVTKDVSYVTPAGQAKTVPANVGNELQYTITITNTTGNSEAYDADVIDTLPANLSLVNGSVTALINGNPVPNFNPTPATSATVPSLPPGGVDWGRQNDDNSLDIPVGQSLVLTYRVQVQAVDGAPITNTAWAAWTSLNNDVTGERTGDGCPTNVISPNTYCSAPASATPVPTIDPTTIAKSVVSDSWNAGLGILRVGDTVNYRLTLSLRPGQLQSVVITDQMAAGLAFDSVVSINGDTTAPFSQTAPFTYTDFTAPTVSGSTVVWNFGNITNSSTTSTFVIEYRARVVTGTLAQQPTTNLGNTATIAYTGSSVPPSIASITVLQPIMSTPTKIDRAGRASPAQVNVTSDIMQFQLKSCNTGTAPAYSVKITDLLASQLNQTTITTPVVSVGGTLLAAGTDYTYTPPAVRGGAMTFVLNTPVNPGQCVTIDYNIGFYTDFGPNQTWNNSVTLDEYWSLPMQSGQKYLPLGPATFTMTNSATISQPSKTLYSPASGEATIGDEVVYRITVPTTVINAALFDVTATDILDSSLAYLSATDVSGNNFTLTYSSGTLPNQINFTIAQIPAGKQAIIEVHARVANNTAANAGVSFLNGASYMYAGTAGGALMSGGTGTTAIPLQIIEPVVTLSTPSVSNLTNPGVAPTVGDILRYTLVFQAAGGAANDTYSSAFDLSIAEELALGLAYNGNVTVSGAGNSISAPNITGDGITTSQSLTWESANSNIDIPEGTTVTVTFDVKVQNNVQSGQTLIASTSAQWTSLNGVYNYERTGTGQPAVNDYFLGPITASITTQLPVLNFTKTAYNVTTGQSGANARPGDTLKYTLTIHNSNPAVGTTNFSLTDELDKLNTSAMFVPGSLTLVTVPTGANTTLTSATGGTKGTGLVSISNLSIAPAGQPNDTLVIEFQARLVLVITSGSAVLNQSQFGSPTLPTTVSDDPSLPGTSDPTRTLIASAPAFRVLKTAQDVTSGTATVKAGDTLRYTITVKNIGTENAGSVTLRDQIPANTSYVANSTRLNGAVVTDPGAGVSPLQNGMSINSPADLTAGSMPADASSTSTNVATITFDVKISTNVVDGTIISNQGFVNGSGAGSGPFLEQPSDDPATPTLNDPTRVIVGNLPLVYVLKTVQLVVDNNNNGDVDPGDVLQYTITMTNSGATSATGVVLTDAVPAYTTYVANSLTMNGAPAAQPDGGVSPLINGIGVVSSGLTPPSPPSSGGTLAAGGTGIVTFKVQVNMGVASGTVISNQGSVTTVQLPTLLTDSDGNPANGYQPTVITVGNGQQLAITKQVSVVGGGTAVVGAELEYLVVVTNIGTTAATSVVITDALPGQLSYVPGSAALNGSSAGISVAGSIITADYSSVYGNLPANGTAVLRFHAKIVSGSVGTAVTNAAQVTWNTPSQNASASVSVDIGGSPGTASLNGRAWHDANFNKTFDSGELALARWTVQVYWNSQMLASAQTDTNGVYRFSGLSPTMSAADRYEIRFIAPNATATTALLGLADSAFTNSLQRISGVTAASGSNLQNLNLPIDPDGVVYNSITRAPIAGATLTMVRASTKAPLDGSCFNDQAQQGQVTLSSGYYKFDINFSDPSCPPGEDYIISVTLPATGYESMPSRIIPPTDPTLLTPPKPPFSVHECAALGIDDALPSVPYCEAQSSEFAPSQSISAGPLTSYYLHFTLSNGAIPGDSQIFNNHIPIDPTVNTAIAVTKTAALVNVTRGQLVPYTITLRNMLGVALQNLTVVDTFPPGFKYVAGSGRVDGQKLEPTITTTRLSWNISQLTSNTSHTIKLLLIVGSGVSESEYVNRAQVIITGGAAASGIASATVRVIPDPTMDCTDIIGKVFDDKNLNGYQDEGEKGLQGVKIASTSGLIMTSDTEGRFHLTCAVIPNRDRGSNFVLKLDDRTLPTGYRMTTENPLVQRATRGKAIKFNFGATLHRVVRLDIADGVFEPGSTEIRQQWKPRMEMLLNELRKAPSVLRISYLADVEDPKVVKARTQAVKREIAERWEQGSYQLTIETEIFWRRGESPERKR